MSKSKRLRERMAEHGLVHIMGTHTFGGPRRGSRFRALGPLWRARHEPDLDDATCCVRSPVGRRCRLSLISTPATAMPSMSSTQSANMNAPAHHKDIAPAEEIFRLQRTDETKVNERAFLR